MPDAQRTFKRVSAFDVGNREAYLRGWSEVAYLPGALPAGSGAAAVLSGPRSGRAVTASERRGGGRWQPGEVGEWGLGGWWNHGGTRDRLGCRPNLPNYDETDTLVEFKAKYPLCKRM